MTAGKKGSDTSFPVLIGLIVPMIFYLGIMSSVAFCGSYLLLANFFHDDAFFYIKTAQNISIGLGSTFDGLNETNGYHPLWLLFLVLLAKINPFYGFDGLRPLFLVHGMLVCASSLTGWRTLGFLGVSNVWRFIFTLFLIGFMGFSDLALESGLYTLTAYLSLLVSICLVTRGKSTVLEYSLIAISFLIVLTRLDSIIFQLCLGGGFFILSLCQRGARSRTRNLLYIPSLLIVPSIVAFLIVGLYNYFQYGNFETISSYLKTGYPGSLITGWFENSILGIKVRMLGVFFAGLFLSAWFIYRQNLVDNQKRSVERLLAAAMFYPVFHPLILYFGAIGGVASWYFTLDIGLVILGAVYLAYNFENLAVGRARVWRAVRYLSVLMVLSFVVIYLYPRFHNPHRLPQLTMAKWLKQNVAPAEAIYQVDGTGFTGYFSERSVINGDGLINGWDYQKALQSDELLVYLKAKGVRWMVCH